jgi:hypothetical protein
MGHKIPRKAFDWKNRDRSLAVAALRIRDGDVPSAAELAGILEANGGKELPGWFVKIVCAELRGQIKRKRGRKRQSEWRATFVELAGWDYRRHVHWLQRRKKKHGLRGWSCIRGASWWQGPVHERALAIVYQRYRSLGGFTPISLRRFRNLISSRK